MKRILFSLCAALLLTFGLSDMASARGKALVGQDVITMMQSRDFTFTVNSIVGLPVDVANKLALPISTLEVEPDDISVNLPYFTGTAEQNFYNFSTWGRMLNFESENYKVIQNGLNKKGTSYIMKIEAYATDRGGFATTFVINVGADGSAVVTTTWQNNMVTYSGMMTPGN